MIEVGKIFSKWGERVQVYPPLHNKIERVATLQIFQGQDLEWEVMLQCFKVRIFDQTQASLQILQSNIAMKKKFLKNLLSFLSLFFWGWMGMGEGPSSKGKGVRSSSFFLIMF